MKVVSAPMAPHTDHADHSDNLASTGNLDNTGDAGGTGGTGNIDAVRSAYQAFHNRDVAGLLAVMDPDVEWVHPEGMDQYGLGGVKHGHSGVEEFLGRVPTVLGGMRLEPAEFIQAGDRVVVFGTREVKSLRGHTTTLQFVHSWTFRGGRAIRMEDIFDTVPLTRLIES